MRKIFAALGSPIFLRYDCIGISRFSPRKYLVRSMSCSFAYSLIVIFLSFFFFIVFIVVGFLFLFVVAVEGGDVVVYEGAGGLLDGHAEVVAGELAFFVLGVLLAEDVVQFS